MHRKRFAIFSWVRQIKLPASHARPFAAAAGAALLLWLAAREGPVAVPVEQSPAIDSKGPKVATSVSSAAPPRAPVRVQEASVAATIEVVVGRNDTLDAIFGRMALDPADLAAIRNLPGIRQSLDFLKPGDVIKLKHSDRELEDLSRKVSETQTLDVVRGDAGFAAKCSTTRCRPEFAPRNRHHRFVAVPGGRGGRYFR